MCLICSSRRSIFIPSLFVPAQTNIMHLFQLFSSVLLLSSGMLHRYLLCIVDKKLFPVLAAPINVHYRAAGISQMPATQEELHANVDKTNVVNEAEGIGTRIQMFSQPISQVSRHSEREP